MFNVILPARVARRVLALATALGALLPLNAQDPGSGSGSLARSSGGDIVVLPPALEVVHLDQFVTTATRTLTPRERIGSAVDRTSAEQLAQRQITSLNDALGTLAGTPAFTSGATGGATSLFTRGANSNQTLFLVDGIRLNDPNTDYQVFLGGASLGAFDTLEIARGPQSTLYGAEAIGGVVAIRTERGTGLPTARVGVEGGSFGTIAGSVASQGTAGVNGWSFSARGAHTDNERANNRFNAANVALRLDRQVMPHIDIGATVRWLDSELGSPSDRFANDPNNREAESNLLATAFVDARLGDAWKVHAVLGGQDRRYINDMPTPNPPYGSPAAKTVIVNRRGVFDGQTTFTGIARHRITGGLTAEANATRNTGFGAIDKKQALVALFAQDEVALTDRLYVTAGLRHDDFDAAGQATTGRATVAWLLCPAVKARASYGTGFRAPSFLELYGRALPFYVGNPKVGPERNRGFDAGLDYYLPQNRGTLSVTWFDLEFTNLIDSVFNAYPTPSTVQNVGRARTQGVELSAQVKLSRALAASASYAYLDAQSLTPTGHVRLLRRPRHQVSADAHYDFGGGVIAGAGLQYVGRRDDVDAQFFYTLTAGGYTVARAYVGWAATANLTLKARLENALDRTYEPVNGFPALGLGAFVGAEWRF